MRGEGGNLKPEFWREMSVEMKEDRSGGKRKDCMTAETNSARETGPSSHTLDPVVSQPYHDISGSFPDGTVLTLCGQKIRTNAKAMQRLFDESDCTRICLHCERMKRELDG